MVIVNMEDAETYDVDVIPIAADGSCFYSAVAMALAEPSRSDELNLALYEMRKRYQNDNDVVAIDAPFLRFIAAASLEDDDLEQYNELCADEGGETFDTIQDLRQNTATTDAWVNFVVVRAMLRGLRYSVGIIIFDLSLEEGVVPLPRQWLHNKKQYILLQLSGHHYNLLRLTKGQESHPLLLDRKTVLHALRAHAKKWGL